MEKLEIKSLSFIGLVKNIVFLLLIQFCNCVKNIEVVDKCVNQDKKVQLASAAQCGDAKSVSILAADFGPDELSEFLYIAAEHGKIETVNALLNAGANPNIIDPQRDWTPICVAIRYGQELVVKRLLKVPEIDVSKPGTYGCSPIEFAIQYSSVAMVRAILDVGAQLDKIPSISTAIKSNNPHVYEIVEELLKREADPNHIGSVGGELTFPLHAVARKQGGDSVKLVELLLENGANPNLLGLPTSPLHLAAMSHNIQLTEALLKGGADPNLYSEVEFLPLLYIEGLLVFCKKISAREGTHPFNEERVSELNKVKNLLKKYGAKINEPNKDGMFPIHKLAQLRAGTPYMMEALLNSGVNADLEDNTGKTALYYAGTSCQVAKFIVLIKKGASFAKAKKKGLDVTALTKPGQRALIHYLAEAQYFDAILEMKKGEKALNLNTQTGGGKTILHYAVVNNVPDIVIDKLVEVGCKLSLKEKDSRNRLGKLPIQVALRSKNWRIFSHLYKKMQEDTEAAKLLKDKDLKAEMDKRCTKVIKEFINEEEAKVAQKAKEKQRQADDSGGAAWKKQAVTKGKKRKVDDDDNEDDRKQKVKNAKLARTVKKVRVRRNNNFGGWNV